jgi:hypothetical protein
MAGASDDLNDWNEGRVTTLGEKRRREEERRERRGEESREQRDAFGQWASWRARRRLYRRSLRGWGSVTQALVSDEDVQRTGQECRRRHKPDASELSVNHCFPEDGRAIGGRRGGRGLGGLELDGRLEGVDGCVLFGRRLCKLWQMCFETPRLFDATQPISATPPQERGAGQPGPANQCGRMHTV